MYIKSTKVYFIKGYFPPPPAPLEKEQGGRGPPHPPPPPFPASNLCTVTSGHFVLRRS